MFLFHSHFIKTNVTAIKLYGDYTLVGVGGYLHVFHKKTSDLLCKAMIFEGEKIYGILPSSTGSLLIYGGRFIKIYKPNEAMTAVSEQVSKVHSDWILDAKWIDDSQKIATVTMHNKLHIWSPNLDIEKEVECEEKCILYSARVCFSSYNDLLIIAGTVFSEVLLWKPTSNTSDESVVLSRLKGHKGVIFCVHYNESNDYICSSSDDRSAILWKIEKTSSVESVDEMKVSKKCQVFGHTSRIFRCQVLNTCFVTAGEDSMLNVWSFGGKLLRKLEAQQADPIWAIECDEESNSVLTGGGDGAVTVFPIHYKYTEEKLNVNHGDKPKLVAILTSGNLVVFTDNGILYYYSRKKRECLRIKEHVDLKSYVLMDVARCKNLLALAGFEGQINIYRERNDALYQVCAFRTKSKTRIFSFHWLTCKNFLVCQNDGKITLFYLKDDAIHAVAKFNLPPSNERWTTCAIFYKNNVIVGDRKGSIHLYEIGKEEPIQTVSKVHNHLGVTKLVVEEDRIISLGRDAVIKTFQFKGEYLRMISSDKLPVTWLLDIRENLLIAFSSNNFIVWNRNTKRILFEKDCGGGHRSWCFMKTSNDMSFVYVKDKIIDIITVNLESILPVDIIEGYHVKEINAIEVVKCLNKYILISGGEDTALRINMFKKHGSKNIITLKSHLSSIRAITTYRLDANTNLVFTAGGRAQVICWKLETFTENGTFKKLLCSEQHSYHKLTEVEESEMRIMDLNAAKINEKITLFCACSDGNIQLFSVEPRSGSYRLMFSRNVFYKLKCVIKLSTIKIFGYTLLVTMATDGNVVFWDVSDPIADIKPFFHITCHQSGINSYSYLQLDNHLVFLTGGDDNAIVLNYIRIKETDEGLEMETVDQIIDISSHCAQITGAYLSYKHFLTTSVDQKLLVFSWKVKNDKLSCQKSAKYITSVTDPQGLKCRENNGYDVFVYGKGIEIIK
nr:unnamed protein product [Callosobruchus chinensis]